MNRKHANRPRQLAGGVLDYAVLAKLAQPAVSPRDQAPTGDEAAQLHANAWSTKAKPLTRSEDHPEREEAP